MLDVEQWSDELGKYHISCLDSGLPAFFEMFSTEGVCTEGVAPDNGINLSICLPKRKSCWLQCPEESLVRQEGIHSRPHDVAAKLERNIKID
jgi:hypothetical protein